jgi:hypothetical protein
MSDDKCKYFDEDTHGCWADCLDCKAVTPSLTTNLMKELKAEFEALKEVRLEWINHHAEIMHEIKMIKNELRKMQE